METKKTVRCPECTETFVITQGLPIHLKCVNNASLNAVKPMPNAHPTLSTTENAESKSTEDCFSASSSHQNVSGNLLDVNSTAKQSVDLTEYVQEADVQDGNSSKDDQSSADKNKRLRKPHIQYQSRFKARDIHDKKME